MADQPTSPTESADHRAGTPYAHLFVDQPTTVRYGCSAFATDDDKLIIFADRDSAAHAAVRNVDFIAAERGIARPEYSVRLRANTTASSSPRTCPTCGEPHDHVHVCALCGEAELEDGKPFECPRHGCGMNDQVTTPTESAEQAWPPPWTLKPTHGQPYDATEEGPGEAVGWDLSFGFRLNVDHDDYEDDSSPLTIGAHFSDADLARGFVKREVTPDQLDLFARLLLDLSAKQRQRTRGGAA